jgi:hypothetical protein
MSKVLSFGASDELFSRILTEYKKVASTKDELYSMSTFLRQLIEEALARLEKTNR